MTITIAIPTYNGEHFIEQSILSVINQTRSPDVFLIIDDGSTDNTVAIIKKYIKEYEIEFIQNDKPNGFVQSWNNLIKHCKTDYISILHQDDTLEPDYLYHIEKAINFYPKVKHFYAACNYIDEENNIIKTAPKPYTLKPILYNGPEYSKNYFNGIITNNHIHRCPGVTTHIEILRKYISYRKEAGHIADDDFFLRVGNFTFVVGIRTPLANYRDHNTSATGSHKNLELQLANDWLFQYQNYNDLKSLLETTDRFKMLQLSIKFTVRVHIYSIIKKKTASLNAARQLWNIQIKELIKHNLTIEKKDYFLLEAVRGEKRIVAYLIALFQYGLLIKKKFM